MLRTLQKLVSLVLLLAAGFVSSAWAQIDYRNLDDDRPVATEDAYPIERHAFELLAGYRAEQERGDDLRHVLPLELGYGAFDNAQLGLRAPLAGVPGTGGDGMDWGLAGLEVFALYNFNTESPHLPALSLRADAHLPAGPLAGDAARVSLEAIATRSWGRTRLHVNAARGFGPEHDLGRTHPLSRWRYSLAADRTLFRQSLLAVIEVLAARSTAGAPVEVDAAAGLRWQWTPTLVLDLGAARRLRREVGPDYAVSIGLSHAFALGWLMPARVD